jgi:uncharacterized protein (DUF2147 family)
MKRLCFLVVLMALSSSAYAGSSLSFVVGGHRIRIEAPRHCNSPSCVSVSIPGIYQGRRWRDRDEDDDRDVGDQVKAPPPTTQQVAAPPAVAPPAGSPASALSPPPAVFKPAAAATQEVAPPQPAVVPPKPLPPPPAMAPPVGKAAEAVTPPAVAAPQISSVSHRAEDQPAGTPIGDWQSEGNKGSVRIERCGRALCGYAINSASSDKGEAVLVNMKPKTGSQWSGSVYSHDSGDTYYGTMAMKGPNALRVEACALGRFYCTGNLWTRIAATPERQITSRRMAPEPRS